MEKQGIAGGIQYYRPISLVCRLRMDYEDVVVRPALERVHNRVVDIAQGGFRRKRSTLDQLFNINELIVKYPGMNAVYLDIKAAYDCVNRELLWSSLYALGHDNDQFRSIVIPLLRTLFDHNRAYLLVNGSRSDPISVTRGLLQGTVLAPMLFNLAINSLPKELRDQYAGVTIDGVKINSLLTADDTALLNRDLPVLREMANYCHEWGLRKGIEFQPSKCVAVGEPNMDISMGGKLIKQEPSAKYLGMWVTKEGVDMATSIGARIKGARQMLQFLRSRGFNGYGFRSLASLRLYPTFVRSKVEYGLALRPLTTKEMIPLQKLQDQALRTMFSVARSTSAAGLNLITATWPIEDRVRFLNASYMRKLHHDVDRNNLTALIYRSQVCPNPAAHSASFVHQSLRNNPRLKDRRMQWMPLVMLPMVADQYPEPVIGRPPRTPQIPPKLRTAWLEEALARMRDKTKSHTAKILAVSAKCHPVISSGSLFRRTQQRAILVWLLGRVATHQECKKCKDDGRNEELSRAHAVECAGVTPDLKAAFGGHLTANAQQATHNATCIDVAISRLKFYERESNRINAVVHAIEQIRTICAGQRAFYDPSEATPDEEWQAIQRIMDQHEQERQSEGESEEEEPLHPGMMAKAQEIVQQCHRQRAPRPMTDRYRGGRRRALPRQVR